MLDATTRDELGARWAYRAGLEDAAALRFTGIAERLTVAGFAPELVALAREAAGQERHHVELCRDLAARFGATPAAPPDLVPDIAPRAWSLRDRVVYEVIAFACVAETANAAVVTAGLPEVDDPACRRAVHTILADEVQHSRLGWRFLATHPLDHELARRLAPYLAVMLRAAVRDELFRPDADLLELGDLDALRRHGTLPVADRQTTFLSAMRHVVLPGLAAAGVDPTAGAAVLDALEARAVGEFRVPAVRPPTTKIAPGPRL